MQSTPSFNSLLSYDNITDNFIKFRDEIWIYYQDNEIWRELSLNMLELHHSDRFSLEQKAEIATGLILEFKCVVKAKFKHLLPTTFKNIFFNTDEKLADLLKQIDEIISAPEVCHEACLKAVSVFRYGELSGELKSFLKPCSFAETLSIFSQIDMLATSILDEQANQKDFIA